MNRFFDFGVRGELEASMQDQPTNLPTTGLDGRPLKSVTQTVLERRATSHFRPDPVPELILDAVLRAGLQAPSGYNLQPWRFIVVRDQANRKRLQGAAFNQAKVAEAPVVIIACGMKDQWKALADEVFQEGVRRGVSKGDPAKQKQGALDFLSGLRMDVWVNRHTMIALTTLMLVAEAYGLDTAPMEGFDAAAVQREFGIPDEAEVSRCWPLAAPRNPTSLIPAGSDLTVSSSPKAMGSPGQAAHRQAAVKVITLLEVEATTRGRGRRHCSCF